MSSGRTQRPASCRTSLHERHPNKPREEASWNPRIDGSDLVYDDDDAREARGRRRAEQDGGSDADDGTSSAAGTSSAMLARVVETILGSGANIRWN